MSDSTATVSSGFLSTGTSFPSVLAALRMRRGRFSSAPVRVRASHSRGRTFGRRHHAPSRGFHDFLDQRSLFLGQLVKMPAGIHPALPNRLQKLPDWCLVLAG